MPTQYIYSLWDTLPFLWILLGIAVGPLALPKIWHRYGILFHAFGLSGLFILSIFQGNHTHLMHESIHTIFAHYLPFIILNGSLYVIAGGIYIGVEHKTTPFKNVCWIGFSTALAGWIGTTGAAMIFIRPLIRMNFERKHKTHLIIFFIFLAGNIGGGLTPIGDPPLFMGFLQGVRFFWPLEHLSFSVLFLSLILLLILYGIDTWLFDKERKGHSFPGAEIHGSSLPYESLPKADFKFKGSINIVLLGICILTIIASGPFRIGDYEFLGHQFRIGDLIREIVLLLSAFLSKFLTDPQVRRMNHFNFEPLKEIAEVFFAIFISLIPVVALLHMGKEGPLGFIFHWVSTPSGLSPVACYWGSGAMSAFLDNAPTYLLFFHLAGGNADHLMHVEPLLLQAISMGAVFFGALTYIGNAPNFLIRSIANTYEIKMPSFFAYMGWSVSLLIPLLAILSWLRFGKII